MSVKKCVSNSEPCNSCPDKCINTPNMYNCAGPAILTNEDNIGSRPCCNGYQKCKIPDLGIQFCSHTGDCPKIEKVVYTPQPKTKENYQSSSTRRIGIM